MCISGRGKEHQASGAEQRPESESKLVQIAQREKGPSSFRDRLASGPLADKFFAASGLAMLLGGAGIGTHLWLVRCNVLPVPASYLWWRSFHAEVQFGVFFGLLVAGFLLQAGPRVLQVQRTASPSYLLVIPAIYLGTILRIADSTTTIGGVIISSAYIAVALFILRLTWVSNRRVSGTLAIVSLLSLAATPFVNFSLPGTGLALYWGAIASGSAVAGRQFVVTFLGGRAIRESAAYLLLYFFVFAALLAAGSELIPWRSAALVILSVLFVYLLSSRLWLSVGRAFREPLAFAFHVSYLWAVVGALFLAVEPGWIDRTLHIWALGWGCTLSFAVSIQIMQHLAAVQLIKPRTLLAQLMLWQVVVIGRGVPSSLFVSVGWARMMNVIATIVVFLWLFIVLRCLKRIVSAQFQLSGGNRMLLNC